MGARPPVHGVRRRRIALALVVLLLIALVGSVAWLALGERTPAPNELARADLDRRSVEPTAPTPIAVSGVETSAAPPAVTAPSDAEARVPRIRGSVLDERTGDAVPWIHVALSSGGAKVDAVTDEQGTFDVEHAFTGDEITVEVSDLDVVIATEARARALFDDGEPWTLKVAIGPTYLLISDRESVDATWEAKLVELETGAEDVAGRIRVTAEGLELDPRDEPPKRTWAAMQVREGSVPWIRYPVIQHPTSRRYDGEIEAWHPERHIELTGIAKSTLGIHRVVVARPLATGIVSGTVVAGDPGSLSHPIVTVVLVPLGAPDAPGEKRRMWHKQRVRSKEAFAFRNVAAGRWRFFAFAPNHRLETSEILLTRAGRNVQEIRLAEVHESGTWRGSFRAHRPRPPAEHLVQVELATDEHIVQNWIGVSEPSSATMEPSAAQRSVSVAVRGLPVCRLRAVQLMYGDTPAWRPVEFEINAPADDVRFSLIGRGAQSSFAFLVTDASTGAAITDFALQVGPPGSVILDELSLGQRGSTRVLPTDAPFSWMVWAEGFAPVRGNQANFDEHERLRVANVRLERGWGVLLRVRADERNAVPDDLIDGYRIAGSPRTKVLRKLVESLGCTPIPGVEVLVDGEHVVTTDRLGDAWLTSRTIPELLTLRCEGWQIAELQHGLSGHSRAGFPEYVVWMKR